MKIKSDFTIQPVGSFYTAVAVGETSKTFHAMMRLNETGAFLWKKMAERDCTEAELVDAILAEYEAERAVVERDVHAIVMQLATAGVFVEGTEPKA